MRWGRIVLGVILAEGAIANALRVLTGFPGGRFAAFRGERTTPRPAPPA